MSSVTGSMASSMRSGSSMSSVGSAESKAIREFKASVGKKVTPKAVRSLSIAIHVILLVVVAIAVVELILWSNGIDDSRDYLNAIDYANKRVAYVGIVHILARNLIGISKEYYTAPYREDSSLESETRVLME